MGVRVPTGSHEVLRKKIFQVAGMSNTVGETGHRLVTGRAKPYRLGTHENDVVVKSAGYKDLRFLFGAASVYATTDDLFRFVVATRDGVSGDDVADRANSRYAKKWRGWTGRTFWDSGDLDSRR